MYDYLRPKFNMQLFNIIMHQNPLVYFCDGVYNIFQSNTDPDFIVSECPLTHPISK